MGGVGGWVGGGCCWRMGGGVSGVGGWVEGWVVLEDGWVGGVGGWVKVEWGLIRDVMRWGG